MKAFENRVEELPDHDRYLVLNACYATKVLEDQIKAFMPMSPKGIILTHLDEEKIIAGRLTNLLLSAQLPNLLALREGKKYQAFSETFRPARFLTNVFSFLFSSLGKFKQTLIQPGKSYAFIKNARWA